MTKYRNFSFLIDDQCDYDQTTNHYLSIFIILVSFVDHNDDHHTWLLQTQKTTTTQREIVKKSKIIIINRK